MFIFGFFDFQLVSGHLSKRRVFGKLIILTGLTFIGGLIFASIEKEGNEGKKVSPVFKEFHDCVRSNLAHLKGNYDKFWHLFTILTKGCDDLEAYKALDIRTAKNQDEIKYVAFPHQDEHLTMVTLGIGHDVNAELKLREQYPNIEFFGADPVSDINKDLYVNILGGNYFEYAVSGTSGMRKAKVCDPTWRYTLIRVGYRVSFTYDIGRRSSGTTSPTMEPQKEFSKFCSFYPLEQSLRGEGYEEKTTKHIGVHNFFKNVLHKDRIDILWIDIEQNEYPILEQLHSDGLIDRAGVKICQINVELHKDLFEPKSDSEMIKFHDFVWKLLEDKKYIMMKPYYVKGLKVKNGNKWIVVTSINYPTDDVKRLAAIPDWNLVVVGDTKTPKDWELPNKHSNVLGQQTLCYQMPRPAVQQGLVHHDPDVDAIYRLLHANPKTGLDIKFNEFAPPIILSVGTYSPWNSQNTLFHKSAFHTLFLPTTVSFRTTDIWRSFISQKILHLSGLTVSFVPTNAVQFRNAHDYLKDFKDEKSVYEDSGRFLEFLHSWNCKNGPVLENCINQLAEDLVENNFWRNEDAKLMMMFLSDLKLLGFEFPEILKGEYVEPYLASANETERNVNCRRMNLEFELVDPRNYEQQNLQKAGQKLQYFGDLVDWCKETGYSDLLKTFPSAQQLSRQHEKSDTLQKHSKSVLVVVNNYPWKYGHGIIQRLYQPYFAAVVFCGSWYPDQVKDHDNYTSTIQPFNFIHMNPTEMRKGYSAYHCLTLAKEMGLANVQGYFLMADDAIFNIWQEIDFSTVHHSTGVVLDESDLFWDLDVGIFASRNVVKTFETSKSPRIQNAWKQFQNGLEINGNKKLAKQEMTSGKGRTYSDFFYIPNSESEYYATLMRVFFENGLYLEIAVDKFMKSVKTQESPKTVYIWNDDREKWDEKYSKTMIGFHPVKLSQFQQPGKNRTRYCRSILQTWADVMFSGSQNLRIL
ncbi:hypothetical protein L5515_007098 [Caenorhabditis briggsae]|uniref:Methyltransferase FkbM domain-containing protein n=1 Tax=Caenorhabditis briggsae TaxID=6238 RepID=A0AAE9F0Y6_CAEBR|nr:hypothetical protein L5515_007098 [Caenorhabditis briggsae]